MTHTLQQRAKGHDCPCCSFNACLPLDRHCLWPGLDHLTQCRYPHHPAGVRDRLPLHHQDPCAAGRPRAVHLQRDLPQGLLPQQLEAAQGPGAGQERGPDVLHTVWQGAPCTWGVLRLLARVCCQRLAVVCAALECSRAAQCGRVGALRCNSLDHVTPHEWMHAQH